MKLKHLVVGIISTVMVSSVAYAANPAVAADMLSDDMQPQTLASADTSNPGNMNSGAAQQATGADSMSASNNLQNPLEGAANGNDDMSADTATGDDDY